MLFSSILFLFLFLPLVLFLSLITKNIKLQNIILLFASLIFYAWGEKLYVFLMFFSITCNYLFALAISNFRNKKKHFLIISVFINLGLLVYFKYANFIVNNLNSINLFPQINIENIHLPIGISFFTFQALSYILDVYRNVIPAQKNIFSLGLYISLFPQLIAGPIVRYHDIVRQILKRSLSRKQFSIGVERFIIGMSKKILIANTMAEVADKIFAIPTDMLSFPLAWLGIICYSLQIYFDFSGYSDMAIGLGKMFGLDFLENFNYPYIAKSIKDFWRRWHISLSRWFRDYLYISLGGNKLGKHRTCINLLIVFFLCGLWHGASWNFIIWGLWHGLFLIFERLAFGKKIEQLHALYKHLYVLLVVTIGWVFFRTETLLDAIMYIKAMSGFSYINNDIYHLGLYLNKLVLLVLLLGIIGSTNIFNRINNYLITKNIYKTHNINYNSLFTFVKIYYIFIIFILSISSMASGSYNPFIYFRF